MKIPRSLRALSALLLSLGWLTAMPAAGQNTIASLQADDENILPVTPAAVLDIVEIQPFRLRQSYQHDWLASRPVVSSGLLVVLQVDPSYVLPRNSAEPVLYAGDQTIQRLNQGHASGYVIGIVPGDTHLESAPVWFGQPELPERVTGEILAAQKALADRAGIEPFSAEQIERAWRENVEVEDLTALLRGPAADLVLKYSPDERDLAETWRLPSAGSR